MTNTNQQAVDFLGHQINSVEDADRTHFVPLKWLCEILGVDHNSQRREVKGNELYQWKNLPVKGADGRLRKMFCLPLEQIFFWAYTVDSCRVKPEIKETFLQYQEECTMALVHAQRHGIALNPREDANKTEKSIREGLEQAIKNIAPDHFDQRLFRQVVFHAELKLLNRFSKEPPRYWEKACECILIAVDRYLDWVGEYERNASNMTSN